MRTLIRVRFLLFLLLLFCPAASAVEDSLEVRLKKVSGIEKIDLLNRLAEEYVVRIPARSLDYARQALALSLQSGYAPGEARARNNIGEYYLINGNYSEALATLEQALAIGRAGNHMEAIAQSLTKIGAAYYFQGDYRAALRHAAQALPMHRQANDLRAVANTQNMISYCYSLQGMPEKALEAGLRAYAVRRELKDPNEIAKSLNSLGDFYLVQNNLRRALRNYLESLRISRQIQNRRGIAFSLDNLGRVYLRQERYQEALLYFREAQQISNELSMSKQKAAVHVHMGNAYAGLNDTTLAFRNYAAALRIHYTQKNELDMVSVLNEIGRLNTRQGKPKTALSYHYQALSKVKNSQARVLLRDTYKNLADTYLELDDTRQFAEYYRAFSNLQDSIQSDLSLRRITELQTQFEWQEGRDRIQFETEQQQLELARQKSIRNYLLALLSIGAVLGVTLVAFYLTRLQASRKLAAQNQTIVQQNRQLRRANQALKGLNDKLVESEAELRKSNETKDKFFSIIAHDLRAPLATFSSFLNALSDTDDTFTPAEIEFITKSTQKSLKNLTDLLNNLLQWSRSQMGSVQFVPQPVPLAEAVQQTAALYAEDMRNKDITLHCRVDAEATAYADANMLDFVLRNLVGNAIKFTPRGGHIAIESVAVPYKGKAGICVSDTGVGIPPENLEKMFKATASFTTVGTANEKGTGLGLVLCREFVERNGGRIWVESEEGVGTRFTFTVLQHTV